MDAGLKQHVFFMNQHSPRAKMFIKMLPPCSPLTSGKPRPAADSFCPRPRPGPGPLACVCVRRGCSSLSLAVFQKASDPKPQFLDPLPHHHHHQTSFIALLFTIPLLLFLAYQMLFQLSTAAHRQRRPRRSWHSLLPPRSCKHRHLILPHQLLPATVRGADVCSSNASCVPKPP